ncbi:putative 2-hydroxyphytanoyl-CoA lyase [Aspergillus nomiae NRRL 13137]|uniref:Putative 2-hydroxyphytanoyl-CoA lyase n=1 Tax=Aspergillus nomiae NRRL (strain ATCC 15546 / NRRL 13137 / CBS 260.88 / M93) TaxID=1509407 RepID=A0A0L1IVM4_ASPN3|nr:putative 2-hydroxyphytanoyl-CoA lyase [Aspergillus nomiae NRRL 13137]KNG83435.1 putative 2-hydroxyphytanoyl-CoA lyase [Aspergillus nomiae NRRL 13137]
MAGFPLKDYGEELNGGDLLAQTLKHLGVEVAFGLHGGHLDAFLQGCEASQIRLIDTRHETVAVQAAESYAKFSKKIGVCFITANSGFSNGIPGLATALADRSPILCITSSPPTRDLENNSLQGIIDQVVVSRPLTKFAYRMTNPEDTPRIVKHAIGVATSGAPGPVLLDFPIDVLFTPVHKPLISWGSVSSPFPYGPGPHTAAIDGTVELLNAAKRPLIILGTGGNSKEVQSHSYKLWICADRANVYKAGESLMKLSETCGIPIFDTMKCKISFIPSQFSFNAGPSGILALLPRLGIQQPDLILLLGARTGMFLGGRSGAIIPEKDCKLVQVDVDGAEIGRTLPVDLGAISDVTQFAAALNRHYDSTPFQGSVDTQWVNNILSVKGLASPYEQEAEVQPSGRLHPYHALKHVLSSVPKESIVILDGGEAPLWASNVISHCSPNAIVKSSGSLGFLGNGFGYALGAAVACPDRTVINLHGDGSAGFHFMDLDTYKRHNLNIMTIVVNNYCWGMSSNGQDLIYGTKTPTRPVSHLSPVTDYSLVAKALGNSSVKIQTISDVAPALAGLVNQNGPTCIELVVMISLLILLLSLWWAKLMSLGWWSFHIMIMFPGHTINPEAM